MPLRTAADLTEGEVLAGKYRVERVIGAGGMGVVAVALHLELGSQVAIKLLLSEASGTDEAIERFSREARAASRLRGEHAVRVFDVGKASDGTPYMVMEYLVGEDLEAVITAGGPLDVSTAVGFVLQASEAIAEAHSIGIVHRDLKPANLFLTRRIDGSSLVKVLDFGIAKRVEPEVGRSLTGTLAVGSPAYMSPEQMLGLATVDTRTDIWALGVCLYELMTGAMPFGGNSVLEICTSVLRDEPKPPSEVRADIPAKLSQAILRCLNKDPAARFSDVAALAGAIEPFALPADRGAASRTRRVLGTGHLGAGLVSSDTIVFTDAPREVVAAVRKRTHWRRRISAAIAFATLALAAGAGLWILPRGRADLVGWRWNAATAIAPHTPRTLDSAPIAVDATPAVSLQRSVPSASVVGATLPAPTLAPRRAPAAAATRRVPYAIPVLAPTSTPTDAPELPVTASAPPVVPVASPPSSPAASSIDGLPAAALPPLPPPFALESARVRIGSPMGVVGTTASNVSRALAKAGSRMTACYREALPRIKAPVDGSGMLHVETDEEGVITQAEMAGPLAADVGECINAAARGLIIPSVDTGRARADVPLVFTGR